MFTLRKRLINQEREKKNLFALFCSICVPDNIFPRINPIRTGRGWNPPPPHGFFPFLKKSSEHPYQKFLDFFQLLVADTAMKF